jgi:hypothetical protein
MLHFAVVFWIPAYAGMTGGTGVHIRHAGERQHPGGVTKRNFATLNEYKLPGFVPQPSLEN